MPILRPLIGMDKDEITAEAERIGTYPTSIIPDEDCCTLFTPRRPATRARVEQIQAAEEALVAGENVNVGAMVAAAIAAADVEDFKYPVLE